MLTSPFPMWPHEITLSEIYYNSYLWHFALFRRARSSGWGCKRGLPARSLWCSFNDVCNHWRWLRFPGVILSCSRWNRWDAEICFCVHLSAYAPLIQVVHKKKKKKKKSPLTACDSVSFQSACIRFITFLSLHLVDASRVPLHWYGRGGLSCDYDIFLGALSSHSISLG